MIRPGEIYLADFDEMEPHPIVVISREELNRVIPQERDVRFQHPIVVISREELNRGNWVAAVLITSKRFEERSKQPHCVPFRAGEFGLSRDCVAQTESLFSIRRVELGEHLGTLDVKR
jgi:mRNA-degrading endonuclease toxin of MazEF toxin-antitoxin module